MLFILAQSAEPPKTLDPGPWLSWICGILVLLVTCIIGYLIKSAKEKDGIASNATTEMTKVFREVIDKLEERHQDEKIEHSEDREAFIASTEHVKETLVKINETLITVGHEMGSIKDEIKRNGGAK